MNESTAKDLSNVEQFKEIFNRIEEWMRTVVDIDKGSRKTIAHSKLIDRLALQNPYVKEYASRLHAFRSLRNALVHWPRTGEGQSIAEPHQEIVDEYRAIFNKLRKPPSILSIAVPIKNIYCVTWDERIIVALEEMVKCNYRQVPVVSHKNNGVYLNGIFDIFDYASISMRKCRDVGTFVLQSSDTFEMFRAYLDIENNNVVQYTEFVSPETTVLDAEHKFISYFI